MVWYLLQFGLNWAFDRWKEIENGHEMLHGPSGIMAIPCPTPIAEMLRLGMGFETMGWPCLPRRWLLNSIRLRKRPAKSNQSLNLWQRTKQTGMAHIQFLHLTQWNASVEFCRWILCFSAAHRRFMAIVVRCVSRCSWWTHKRRRARLSQHYFSFHRRKKRGDILL